MACSLRNTDLEAILVSVLSIVYSIYLTIAPKIEVD